MTELGADPADLVDEALETVLHPDLAQLAAGRGHHAAGDLVVQEGGVEVLGSPHRKLLGRGQPVEEGAGQAERTVVDVDPVAHLRSEEHTSELQSRQYL